MTKLQENITEFVFVDRKIGELPYNFMMRIHALIESGWKYTNENQPIDINKSWAKMIPAERMRQNVDIEEARIVKTENQNDFSFDKYREKLHQQGWEQNFDLDYIEKNYATTDGIRLVRRRQIS